LITFTPQTKTKKMIYQKHVFICTNQRAGNEKKSCGEENGLKLVAEFKKAIKDKHLPIKIRAQKCGCLDVCEKGPALVVYPEGVFYGGVKPEDVARIVDSHLENNIPVTDLRIDL
jgi:(2Fe-2S) ferredoxin